MNTCIDPYLRNMNDFACMNLGEGRPWWGLDKIWVRMTKCIDDDLVRLLGTYLNKKHNHTCVNDVNSACLIDELIWKGVGMMLSANCVINEPWKHVPAETWITPYNASILFVDEQTCAIVKQNIGLWIAIVIILVRNMMICRCS